MNKKKLLQYIISFIIFTITACILTYPLCFHLKDKATGLGDEFLIALFQNWIFHIVFVHDNLFNLPIYFPYLNVLAYSETFITSAIFAIPVLLLQKEPIVTVNFTLISGLLLFGFTTFLLIYYLTKDYLSSFFSSFLLIFSPAVLAYSVHLQVLWIPGVILSILFFLILIKKNSRVYLYLLLICLLLQVYNSFLPVYFIIISVLIISIYNWFYNQKKFKKLITKKNILITFLFFLLAIPITIPYFQVANEFHYSRDIRDGIHNALQFEDLLYTNNTSRLEPVINSLPFNKVSQNNEFHAGYLGLVFSILSLLSIWYVIKNLKKKNVILNSFSLIALTGFLLSLGPTLHLFRYTVHKPFPIILPYTLFYYLVPGFKGFRTPIRWEMLFMIAMAVIIGVVLHNLLIKYSLRKKIVIYSILFLGVILEFSPMHFINVPQIKDFPKVYAWINTTPKNTVIIEMPIYNWNTFPYASIEQLRDYYSISNFRRTVNGYSGFSPPPWQDLVTNLLEHFPDTKTIKTLKDMHITYIIIHKKEYDQMNKDKYFLNKNPILSGESVIKFLKQDTSVHLVKQFGDDYVFTFSP